MPGELIVSLHAVFGGSLCACTVSSGAQSGHAQCLVVHRLCVCVCVCVQCLVGTSFVCARTVSGGTSLVCVCMHTYSIWWCTVCAKCMVLQCVQCQVMHSMCAVCSVRWQILYNVRLARITIILRIRITHALPNLVQIHFIIFRALRIFNKPF